MSYDPSTDTLPGCPDDPICQHCPCAAGDDVCFPGERLRAERDTLREALERIATIADPYPARIAREALAATPAREDEGPWEWRGAAYNEDGLLVDEWRRDDADAMARSVARMAECWPLHDVALERRRAPGPWQRVDEPPAREDEGT